MKSKEKLQAAALTLFAEKGFTDSTVQEIASAAGLTERTFFRQFRDKSDVLFDSDNGMGKELADYISQHLTTAGSPLELAVASFKALDIFDKGREQTQLRSKIIAENPDLRERELLKAQVLLDSLLNALSEKFPVRQAELAARVALEVFHVGFSHWLSSKNDEKFADCITVAFTDLQIIWP